MIDSEALAVTLLVTDVLDKLDIPYVIGGSVASIVHGMMRTTMDVDIVANIDLQHVSTFVASLQDEFYFDEDTIRRAIRRRSSFNLIHFETMFKVDIFLPKERAFDKQQLARRVAEPVGAETEQQVWVLSAEDVILAKLDWFRLGGEVSERQWRDVLGIVKTQQNDLDRAYLRRWARSLQVLDLLERALAALEDENDSAL
jgi:DNA primase large subunit